MHSSSESAERDTRRESGAAIQLPGHLKVSVIATLTSLILVSGVYPVVVWGLAQALFRTKANGSLIDRDGNFVTRPDQAVGSALIGQNFSAPGYFHPRPSSAGNGYDPTASGGSNLGPTSSRLINGATKKDDKGNEVVDFDGIHDRIVHYCLDNGIPFHSSIPIRQFEDARGNPEDVKLIKAFNADTPLVFTPDREIPADAVTASGSGLDPHICRANAQLQASRVAAARKIPVGRVRELIDSCIDGPDLGFLGEPGVNVLRLNLRLDALNSSTPKTASIAGE